MFYRLSDYGALQIVTRHNVDMENQETIDMWVDKVLSAICDIDIVISTDYLPQSLDGYLESDSFHRNRPFTATIKVNY